MTIIDTLNWPSSALAAIETKQAEIERLRAALEEIADKNNFANSMELRETARRALVNEQTAPKIGRRDEPCKICNSKYWSCGH